MIIIALGANLPSKFGSPRVTLNRAVQEIARRGLKVLYQSPIYLTAPVPISDQPWYHNAVIAIETVASPSELIHTLQSIEADFGRIRTERNAPRAIDLDIIAYHDLIIHQDNLQIPHPRMHDRAFVLYPLKDIAPNWVHPAFKKSVEILKKELPSDQEIKKESRPLIMGIVNVTSDSFSDGGQFDTTEKAIAHGLKLIEEGADILDIGGESTRPNAPMVIPEEEQRRVIPVIEGLRNAGALISVDTRNASTMVMALKSGAGMVNDVTALTWDKESLKALENSNCRICLMHMKGTPQTMQIKPHYEHVVQEVYDYLQARIEQCEEAGISKERLMIDVGIGFGKALEHNLSLIKNLSRFHDLGVDILLGTSRKSFIEKICEYPVPASNRLAGSLASLTKACDSGVKVVRVHDVAETKQFIDVYTALSLT